MKNLDKKLFSEWMKVVASAAVTFILLLLACAMCGCKTQYVPVESVRTVYKEADTTAIYNRLLKVFESMREKETNSDSLVDRTKETVVVNVLGDTVRLTRTQYVYVSSKREKELEQKVIQQDSIIKDLRTQLSYVKVDSIPVPYPVEKELTKWEQTKMCIGGLAVIALILVLGFAVISWLARKFRK